jgi:hypothetical protein
MAEIIKFPGKASEANRSFRRERVRIVKQLKRDAELILKGTAGILITAHTHLEDYLVRLGAMEAIKFCDA